MFSCLNVVFLWVKNKNALDRNFEINFEFDSCIFWLRIWYGWKALWTSFPTSIFSYFSDQRANCYEFLNIIDRNYLYTCFLGKFSRKIYVVCAVSVSA